MLRSRERESHTIGGPKCYSNRRVHRVVHGSAPLRVGESSAAVPVERLPVAFERSVAVDPEDERKAHRQRRKGLTFYLYSLCFTCGMYISPITKGFVVSSCCATDATRWIGLKLIEGSVSGQYARCHFVVGCHVRRKRLNIANALNSVAYIVATDKCLIRVRIRLQ